VPVEQIDLMREILRYNEGDWGLLGVWMEILQSIRRGSLANRVASRY
jgi:hypothetical protein